MINKPGTHCWPLAALWGRIVVPGSLTVGSLFSLIARAFLEHMTSAHRLKSAFSGQVPQWLSYHKLSFPELFLFFIPQWLPATIKHSHWSIRKKELWCSGENSFITSLRFSEVMSNMGIQVAKGWNIVSTLRFLQGLFEFYPREFAKWMSTPCLCHSKKLLTHDSQGSPADD